MGHASIRPKALTAVSAGRPPPTDNAIRAVTNVQKIRHFLVGRPSLWYYQNKADCLLSNRALADRRRKGNSDQARDKRPAQRYPSFRGECAAEGEVDFFDLDPLQPSEKTRSATLRGGKRRTFSAAEGHNSAEFRAFGSAWISGEAPTPRKAGIGYSFSALKPHNPLKRLIPDERIQEKSNQTNPLRRPFSTPDRDAAMKSKCGTFTGSRAHGMSLRATASSASSVRPAHSR
jgi:hypothetical protein